MDGGLESRLVSGEPTVRGALSREYSLGLLFERLQPGLGSTQLGKLLVELLLLLCRLGPEVVGRLTRRLEGRVDRGQRLLVGDDLLGKLLVLLADVEVVADLGQHVGEGVARQQRL